MPAEPESPCLEFHSRQLLLHSFALLRGWCTGHAKLHTGILLISRDVSMGNKIGNFRLFCLTSEAITSFSSLLQFSWSFLDSAWSLWIYHHGAKGMKRHPWKDRVLMTWLLSQVLIPRIKQGRALPGTAWRRRMFDLVPELHVHWFFVFCWSFREGSLLLPFPLISFENIEGFIYLKQFW